MERALGDELDGLLVVGPGRGHRSAPRRLGAGDGSAWWIWPPVLGSARRSGSQLRLAAFSQRLRVRRSAAFPLIRDAAEACGWQNKLLFSSIFIFGFGFFGPVPIVPPPLLDASQSSSGEKPRGGGIFEA